MRRNDVFRYFRHSLGVVSDSLENEREHPLVPKYKGQEQQCKTCHIQQSTFQCWKGNEEDVLPPFGRMKVAKKEMIRLSREDGSECWSGGGDVMDLAKLRQQGDQSGAGRRYEARQGACAQLEG